MSGRRGVHHSGGLRAKRRWLKWRRYQRWVGEKQSYPSWWPSPHRPVGHTGAGYRGYVMAFRGWSYRGRYAPIGIRDVRL